MRLRALAFQATLVVGVTATVGYPEFRQPARPIMIWRTAGPLTPRPDLIAGDSRLAYSSATANAALAGVSGGGPGDARGGAFSDRQASRDGGATRRGSFFGVARTALNQPIPFASVALRNIRTGRIESRTRADQNGRFEFTSSTSGDRVVELLGADGVVIAAGDILDGNAGANGTVVRVSANATPRALFGMPGTTTLGTTIGTTTGTTAGANSGVNLFLGSTASEPLGRAFASGIQQTTLPDEQASPRN